jgi:hypothetical protein
MFINRFVDGLTEPPEVSNPDDAHFEPAVGARSAGRRLRTAYELTRSTIGLLVRRDSIDYVDTSDKAHRELDEAICKGNENLAKYQAKKGRRNTA